MSEEVLHFGGDVAYHGSQANKDEGRHQETWGQPRATMSDHRPPRRGDTSYKVRAKSSILSGEELKRILAFLDVPQQRFARHSGRNQATIQRFCSGNADGDIPLWVEWMLMMYWNHPWTKRIRGRLQLPLRQWDIDRDDETGEGETEVHEQLGSRGSSSRGFDNPRYDAYRLRAAMRLIRETGDISEAHRIATGALVGNIRADDDQATSPTPAEPWGNDYDTAED